MATQIILQESWSLFEMKSKINIFGVKIQSEDIFGYIWNIVF